MLVNRAQFLADQEHIIISRYLMGRPHQKIIRKPEERGTIGGAEGVTRGTHAGQGETVP
jgi:hypothetical protein